MANRPSIPSFGSASHLSSSRITPTSAHGLHREQQPATNASLASYATAQASKAAVQQTSGVQGNPWPGVLSSGLPFMMPPMPDGFMVPPVPPIPPPQFSNNQAMDNGSGLPMPFPFSAMAPAASTPLQQPTLQGLSGAKIATLQQDKEEGEVSELDAPTGPAAMQGRNQKDKPQTRQERPQQNGYISRKQARREERRALKFGHSTCTSEELSDSNTDHSDRSVPTKAITESSQAKRFFQ